jgi:cytochrome P450
VIGAMVGVRIEDTERFMHWADAVISYPVDNAAGIAASRELSEYLRPMIQDRRQSPRDDLTSVLVAAEVDGERLGDGDSELSPPAPPRRRRDDVPAPQQHALRSSHPEQLEELRANAAIDSAVDEVVRWFCPHVAQTTREQTLQHTIPAGHSVVACLGSANRDRHYRPDRYDIHRARKECLSFGAGRHFCLGVHLARLELRCALTAIFDRLDAVTDRRLRRAHSRARSGPAGACRRFTRSVAEASSALNFPAFRASEPTV